MEMTQTDARPPLTPDEAAARGRILGAAFGAFLERGYAQTSTLEIATRAKVSKRDLYALVGNKQTIFNACVAHRAARMAPSGSLPPAGDQAEFVATLRRFGANLLVELWHPTVVGAHRLAIAEAEQAPELGRQIDTVRQANRAAVSDFLIHAQAQGLLAGGEADVMAQTFLNLLVGETLLARTMGLRGEPPAGEADHRAEAAVDALARLYGAAR